MGNTLSFFKSCFAFLKTPGQFLALVIGSFAFGDVCYYAGIFEFAGVVSSRMCDYMDVSDNTVWQENFMLDIQIDAALRGTIPKMLQAVAVRGVNSVEYKIECGIGFSREA
jgi:hypothetical protein